MAQEPLEDRAASRLLWLHRGTGEIEHRSFRDIPSILRPGDLLVVNDTRVTARRLLGRRRTGGQVEALVLGEAEPGIHAALMRPAKRLRVGEQLEFEGGFAAEVVAVEPEGRRRLRFASPVDLSDVGQVPLPPYIHRSLDDPERYQTVYAREGGSAAAATAGLHFTDRLLADLQSMGVGVARVTLDVGIDTFRPVASEDTADHTMHGERCTVPEETAAAVAGCRGRVVAVGTTTVRALETFAVGPRRVASGTAVTRIFIEPGHRFQSVDGMFTNFHLPRTTMLLMVGALAGRAALLAGYAQAVEQHYRFLSFGDSMLVL